MSDHARLSPSGAHRWTVCPASVARSAGFPDKDTPDSLRGTAAHALLEAYLKGEQFPDFINMMGTWYHKDTDITLDAEDISAVFTAWTYLSKLEGEKHSEMRVVPGEMIGRDDCHGTQDYMGYTPDMVEVADYKHGFGIVEPEENLQLILYGLGTWAKLAREGKQIPAYFKLTIIQPRAPHPKGVVRSWGLTEAQLVSWGKKLAEAAIATDDPQAKAVPGEKQCKWCKAKGTCPELTAHSIQAAQAMFTPVPTTHSSLQMNLSREPSELTVDQLLFVQNNAALIRGFLDAVDTHLLEAAKNGAKIPGHKIVRGPGSRKFGKPDEVKAVLDVMMKLDGRQVTKADYMKEDLKSPKQLEDTLRTQISKEDYDVLQGMVTKTAGNLFLVPLSDPREEVKTAIEDIFKPVTPPLDIPGVDLSFLQ